MAHTPLFARLKSILAQHHAAAARGIELERLRDERAEAQAAGLVSRRKVLGGAAVALAASALPLRRAAAAGSGARVVIIGGGLAGLNAALTLADAGLRSTLYEAMPNRLGGRVLSDRQDAVRASACGACHTVEHPRTTATWASGQVTDVFGEMIDTAHVTMQDLCARFDLPLVDMPTFEPAGSTGHYYFGGQRYFQHEVDRDFAAMFKTLRSDLHGAHYPSTWDNIHAKARALDSMSVYSWIESRVPGGHGSQLGKLIDVAYAIEYGADTTDQSALNLVYLLGYSSSKTFQEFGESDERYRVEGGVDRVPAAIASYLASTGLVDVHLGAELRSLALASDGRYDLSFEGASSTRADAVVLAMPFMPLRDVDISRAGFDARKLCAINEQGAGKNGKIQVQFKTRLWNTQGPWGINNGDTYSDTGYQCTWDPSRGMAGPEGILVGYTGGSGIGALTLRHPYGNIARTAAVALDARTFLSQIEPVFPGLTAQWNGRAAGAMPHTNPFWKCSYSYWRVGQYQAFVGYEAAPQGNVFFAGEHTSLDFGGFMEGAAAEGVRAGEEVLAALRVR